MLKKKSNKINSYTLVLDLVVLACLPDSLLVEGASAGLSSLSGADQAACFSG